MFARSKWALSCGIQYFRVSNKGLDVDDDG